MIIQNHNEYERLKYALEHNYGGCNRYHTPADCECSKAPGKNKAWYINHLCKRMFPKVINANRCPCYIYNTKYIRHKCRVEMDKWLNRHVR